MLPFRFRRHLFGIDNPPDSENSESAASSTRKPETSPQDHTFYPSLWDVLKVRYLLQWKACKAGLPAELVDAIVDAAEYWPSAVREMEGGARIISTDRDQVLLKTVPLCYDRKVCNFPSYWRPCWTYVWWYFANMLRCLESRTAYNPSASSSPHRASLPQDHLPPLISRSGPRPSQGEHVRIVVHMV